MSEQRKCQTCGTNIPTQVYNCVNTDCFLHKMHVLERDESSFTYVKNHMEYEGFDNCFENYSDFVEVNDETFHTMRRCYLQVKHNLEQYIVDQAKLEEEDISSS